MFYSFVLCYVSNFSLFFINGLCHFNQFHALANDQRDWTREISEPLTKNPSVKGLDDG